MSDLRPASSEESLKDWTFIAQDGGLRGNGPNRRGSAPDDSDDRSSIDEADIVQKSVTELHTNGQAASVGKEAMDSDVDFVQIDEDPDEHLDDWVHGANGDQSLENSFVRRPHYVIDGELHSEECLEGESDCEDDSSLLNSDSEDETLLTEHEVDGDELPADYPQRYCSLTGAYNHTRNNHVNEWLSTVLFIVLAVVTGLAVGHFFGTDSHVEIASPTHLGKPVDFHRPVERPSTVILSDVQKSQMEILKQLQEMMHQQSDLKHRITTLEDENRDLRLRLLENRKRCTRIIHKPIPAFFSAPNDPLRLNFSSKTTESLPDDLAFAGAVQPSRNPPYSQAIRTRSAALPSTISAVVVPRKHAPEIVSTFNAHSDHSVLATNVLENWPKFEPFYYPLMDREEVAQQIAFRALIKRADWRTEDRLEKIIPLKQLVGKRQAEKKSPAAPKSAILAPSAEKPLQTSNWSVIVDKMPVRMKDGIKKKPGLIKTMKSHTDIKKIKENKKKFEEEYAEFKMRWKNISRDGRKDEKLKNVKKHCNKAKVTDASCEDGYCYAKPKKYEKYGKKERGSGMRFWDSLPEMVRKHFSQNTKLEKILRNLGKDISTSRLLKHVAEEVPKRLKMSTDWWECQWNWWQNYARNRHVSAYSNCAGYLTSWQNRYKAAASSPASFRSSRTRTYKKNRTVKAGIEATGRARDRQDDDWIWRRAALREQNRLPRDWSFLRAMMREKYRTATTLSENRRRSSTSWWFFERARSRSDRRHVKVERRPSPKGATYGPVDAFLKHQAMRHGSARN